MSKKDIEALIVKLNSEGMSSAMIGTRLRDQYGVPSIKLATGKSIIQILKDNKVKIELPEDLNSLLKRVSILQKHLRENPKDLHNQRGLHLMEARIRRLVKYYQKKGEIPKTWRYSSEAVKLQAK